MMIDRATVWVNGLLDYVVPDTARQDAENHRQAKRVAGFGVSFFFWSLLFGGIYTALGAPESGLIVASTCLPIVGSLLAVRRGLRPAFAGNLLCASGWTALTASAAINGGCTASPLLWYTTLPVVSVLTSGAAWGLTWTLIPLCSIALFATLQAQGVEFANELPPSNQLGFSLCALAGLVVCQFVLGWLRVGIEQRALLALHETNASLVQARTALASLKTGFGFSMGEWTKLQREKAALERFVRLKFGDVEVRDCDLPSDVGAASGA